MFSKLFFKKITITPIQWCSIDPIFLIFPLYYYSIGYVETKSSAIVLHGTKTFCVGIGSLK